MSQLNISLYNKSLKLIRERNISQAIKLLNDCCYIDDSSIDALNLLGLCFYCRCSFDKAKYLWNKSISIKKEENRAFEYLQFITSKDMYNLITIYNEGIELIVKKKYDEAVCRFKEVLELQNELIEPYIIIGLICLKDDNFLEAKKNFEKAMLLDTGNESVRYYYNYILRKMKSVNISDENKGALRVKNKRKRIIILLFSVLAISAFVFASLSIKTPDINSQENDVQSVADTTEKDKEIEELKDKLTKTEISLNNLINKSPDEELVNKDTWTVLQEGLSQYNNGKNKEAINNFSYVINKSLNSNEKSEAVFWLANCYENLTNYDMAIETYKLYLEDYANDSYYDDSLYNLAILLYKENRHEEAVYYAQKMINECSRSIYNNDNIKNIIK